LSNGESVVQNFREEINFYTDNPNKLNKMSTNVQFCSVAIAKYLHNEINHHIEIGSLFFTNMQFVRDPTIFSLFILHFSNCNNSNRCKSPALASLGY